MEIRISRALLLSTIYFLILVGYMTFLLMRTLASVEPDALVWYLTTYSFERLIGLVLMSIIKNPLLALGFLFVVGLALLFGFLTETGIGLFWKYFLSRYWE